MLQVVQWLWELFNISFAVLFVAAGLVAIGSVLWTAYVGMVVEPRQHRDERP